jgi:uncharacterized protein (TIGR02996 family)
VADPLEETRWLVLADWLDENNDPSRAELIRLHRRLLATCCEPEVHPERSDWQARIVELLDTEVRPCMPRHSLTLPRGLPLAGVFIPPGAFLMGGTENEKPVSRVTVPMGFYLSVRLVTQAQWQAVMGTNPSYFKGPIRPVDSVSWDSCREFCTKLTWQQKGYATVFLPTEAEWEYACRSGTTTHYHFGDVPSADRVNYNGVVTWNGSKKGTNHKQTTDVGEYPPNPWGVFDLHGNLWEWCADWYKASPADGQEDIGEEARVTNRMLRGGSWYDRPEHCRAASRSWRGREYCDRSIGFRVCFRLG